MEIQGKTALVTGAGSGIGRASALRLAAEGAAVAVADVDEQGGRDTVGQIEAAGGRAAFVRADVTDPGDVRAMIAFTQETFGALDILHNNAGVLSGRPRFPDAEQEQWSRTVDTNLRGAILVAQYVIQAMRERGGGAIVNTSSWSAIIGFAPDPVYAATKGGVMMFTTSLARLKDELNIRVNCVCPGLVDTPMLQSAGEDAEPEPEGPTLEQILELVPVIPAEEVADAVVELIRDDSLAGRAIVMPNGQPRELLPQPQGPVI
jgi:NAD(P)-dependent dehydrogenase (short-subunit alcohol dehydrogenase family)